MSNMVEGEASESDEDVEEGGGYYLNPTLVSVFVLPLLWL